MKKIISLVVAMVIVVSLGLSAIASAYNVDQYSNIKVNGIGIGNTYAINKCITLPIEKTLKTLKMQYEYTNEEYYWVNTKGYTTYKDIDYINFNQLHSAINWVNSMGIECKYTYNKKNKSITTYTVKIKGTLLPYDYEDDKGNKFAKWQRVFSNYTYDYDYRKDGKGNILKDKKGNKIKIGNTKYYNFYNPKLIK